jgi:plasmid stability protein
VKTTLEIPDDLMRTVRIRAAREDRKLKDLIAELLRRGLERDPPPTTIARRVQFPLVTGTSAAASDDEITPERAAQILLDEEIAASEQ